MVRVRGKTWYAPPQSDGSTEVRTCEWPDCHDEGLYRAPRSRQELNQYRWYCLDHIRLVNASWNYYDGMDDQEVEADIRRDTVWRRPSWNFGVGKGGRGGAAFRLADGFGLFDDTGKTHDGPHAHGPLSEAEKAMVVLDLHPPVTVVEVKTRYKELVKLNHPDAHGGDKGCEERLKLINQAYATIMSSLT